MNVDCNMDVAGWRSPGKLPYQRLVALRPQQVEYSQPWSHALSEANTRMT